MNEWVNTVLELVQSVDPIIRTAVAGLFILLETSVLIGLIVPGDSVVLVASTAVSSPIEYFSLVAVVIVGSLAGSSIGFSIGRFFGPRLRNSRLALRLGQERITRAEYFLDRRGGIAVFVSRFLPVLGSLTPLIVGMSNLRYRVFMAWLTPACIVWAFAYVSAGSAAAEGFRELSTRLSYAGVIFVAIVLGFALLLYTAKRLLEAYVERHSQSPGDGDATTRDD